MEYVLLMGPVQLLQPWNQIEHCYSQFLLHLDFPAVLAFFHRNHGKPNFAKKKNTHTHTHTHIYTIIKLETELTRTSGSHRMVFDGC